MLKTEQQIIDECLELADAFYQMMGYISRPGFKYYESPHPQEQMVWAFAVYAYDHIEGTDVEGALDNME